MDEIYMITGITGHLGRTIAGRLTKMGKQVIGLRRPGDKKNLLSSVRYFIGDVGEPSSLQKFFKAAEGKRAVLIHCAGIVTVASKNEALWRVNVDGTRNIIDLSEAYNISKLIYVSSVHAIPEQDNKVCMCETDYFSASQVKGIYAKSKAEATAYVLKAAGRGFPAIVVHPSGIIGPGDYTGGYMTNLIKAYLKGYLPVGVKGGYDFADVRDVAEGIIMCCEKGRVGECYILSNEYYSIRKILNVLADITKNKKIKLYLPIGAARIGSYVGEKLSTFFEFPLLFTPYSIYTLGSNSIYSHKKADEELGYRPRPLEETLADTVRWLRWNERKNN